MIVVAQFLCTSIWFAGNGVMSDLVTNFQLSPSALGHLTSAVQFGFISGTLTFALFNFADRFSPSRVFLYSAVAGAFFNLGGIWNGNTLGSLFLFRFMTGFFLAGIYPVGMKIATDYFDRNLSKSLGYLVGALVLGTAFPHLLKSIGHTLSWRYVMVGTSVCSLAGGLGMFFLVPDGPFRKAAQKVDLSAFFSVFKNKQFRSAAFGYFGHMWELYAFWAFVPIMLSFGLGDQMVSDQYISLWAFMVIGIGGPACVIGGFIARTKGPKQTALFALYTSFLCCLLSPVVFYIGNFWVTAVFLLFWGMVVIADSPLFSTMVAQNAESEIKGTALTIVNCIGFSITIISIQLISALYIWNPSYTIFMILGVGPVFGIISLRHRSS